MLCASFFLVKNGVKPVRFLGSIVPVTTYEYISFQLKISSRPAVGKINTFNNKVMGVITK